ncbi:MAG: hypothetical protein BZY82_07040 [SAR202 cluster bacterium Io17-Chloro-G3]|nr:MAG: hypothetical protein BZY82_07040 [SAR202 cluster bacterium Io17-Chloro-G3]
MKSIRSNDGSIPKSKPMHSYLLTWYSQHKRNLPWRNTGDPYGILLSEVMLQQTQVSRVFIKYNTFLHDFPSIQFLAKASRATVIRAWQGLGYNIRAIRLHLTAQILVSENDGRVPKLPSELILLPGIGNYSAAAIACFAFGEHVAVVDTNVKRVLGRVFFGLTIASDHQINKMATSLVKTLPRGYASSWNQALMDLGSLVCKSRIPHCVSCPLQNHCLAAPHFQKCAKGHKVIVHSPSHRLTDQQERFFGSSRYYRGRIVQVLRELPEGTAIDLVALGKALRDDFTFGHLSWLHEVVAQLQREGLLSCYPESKSVNPKKLTAVEVKLP